MFSFWKEYSIQLLNIKDSQRHALFAEHVYLHFDQELKRRSDYKCCAAASFSNQQPEQIQ